MPGEDLHLPDHARSQAHEGAAPSAPGPLREEGLAPIDRRAARREQGAEGAAPSTSNSKERSQ